MTPASDNFYANQHEICVRDAHLFMYPLIDILKSRLGTEHTGRFLEKADILFKESSELAKNKPAIYPQIFFTTPSTKVPPRESAEAPVLAQPPTTQTKLSTFFSGL